MLMIIGQMIDLFFSCVFSEVMLNLLTFKYLKRFLGCLIVKNGVIKEKMQNLIFFTE